MQIVHGFLAQADVEGPRVRDRRFHSRTRLEIIRRDHDVDVVDRLEHRQVVQRMMGCAQRAVADAGAYSDQLDRLIGIGHIVLDLLQPARGEKAGRRYCKCVLARRRQPCGNPYQVLLGDADLNDLLR